MIYGCYAHLEARSGFHRRCYWLLRHPEIILVHYLAVDETGAGRGGDSDGGGPLLFGRSAHGVQGGNMFAGLGLGVEPGAFVPANDLLFMQPNAGMDWDAPPVPSAAPPEPPDIIEYCPKWCTEAGGEQVLVVGLALARAVAAVLALAAPPPSPAPRPAPCPGRGPAAVKRRRMLPAAA